MKSIIFGLVILLCLIQSKFAQADKTDESRMKPMAPGTRSLWMESDYDDGEDDERSDAWDEKEKRNQPPGVWGKRENLPPGVWGKRSKQPPGIWGKRGNYLRKKANVEGREEGQREGGSPGIWRKKRIANKGKEIMHGRENILDMANYIKEKHALERRKLALIETVKRLKDALDEEN